MTLQEKIKKEKTLGKNKTNPAYKEGRRMYPVPELMGDDLVPPYNPEVWTPPNPNPNVEDGCE